MKLNCGDFSSIRSKMAAWQPFLCKNINKLPHNSKTIALSNFVLITKIIVHGNMHPKDYWSLTLTFLQDQFHHKMANLTFKLCFKVKGQRSKIIAHGNTHPVKYWSLTLTFMVKSSISSQNGKFALYVSRSKVNEAIS